MHYDNYEDKMELSALMTVIVTDNYVGQVARLHYDNTGNSCQALSFSYSITTPNECLAPGVTANFARCSHGNRNKSARASFGKEARESIATGMKRERSYWQQWQSRVAGVCTFLLWSVMTANEAWSGLKLATVNPEQRGSMPCVGRKCTVHCRCWVAGWRLGPPPPVMSVVVPRRPFVSWQNCHKLDFRAQVTGMMIRVKRWCVSRQFDAFCGPIEIRSQRKIASTKCFSVFATFCLEMGA